MIFSSSCLLLRHLHQVWQLCPQFSPILGIRLLKEKSEDCPLLTSFWESRLIQTCFKYLFLLRSLIVYASLSLTFPRPHPALNVNCFPSLATSTLHTGPDLHLRHLPDTCLAELHLWLHLLENWNGISFFYKDHLTNFLDIQLYTDTLLLLVLGVSSRRRFAAEWPPELANQCQEAFALQNLPHTSCSSSLETRLVLQIHPHSLSVVNNQHHQQRTLQPSIMPFLLSHLALHHTPIHTSRSLCSQ